MQNLLLLIPGFVLAMPMFAEAAILSLMLYRKSGRSALRTKFYYIFMVTAVSGGFLCIFQSAYAASDRQVEEFSLLYMIFETMATAAYCLYLFLRSFAASPNELCRRVLKITALASVPATLAVLVIEFQIEAGIEDLRSIGLYANMILGLILFVMESVGLGVFLNHVLQRHRIFSAPSETDIVAKYGCGCTLSNVCMGATFLTYGKIDMMLYLTLTGLFANAIILQLFLMKINIMRFVEQTQTKASTVDSVRKTTHGDNKTSVHEDDYAISMQSVVDQIEASAEDVSASAAVKSSYQLNA